tara:strand:- start:389 stop:1171 length:783 start_codon:yes stop_codon:yes gene_type:complete
MFLKSYFLKSGEKLSLDSSTLDKFKAQGFPDQLILDHLKVDYYKFGEIVKNWETMQDYINLNNQTNFVKTHNAMCTVNSYKFTTSKNTIGAIYLVRDPRDVLVSYSHHLGSDYEKTFVHLSSSYNYEYPSSGGKNYEKTLMGTWSEHYNSWKNYNSCKVLIVKYEDMILNDLNTFTKIINYLKEIDGIELNMNKLNKALEQTRFSELQKMEKIEGFKEKGKGDLFFRNGKIGAWKDDVPLNIIKKIEKLFKKEMTELGYL